MTPLKIYYEDNHDPDPGKYCSAIIRDLTGNLLYIYDAFGSYVTIKGAITDIHIDLVTYNPTSQVVTITETNGAQFLIDLSGLQKNLTNPVTVPASLCGTDVTNASPNLRKAYTRLNGTLVETYIPAEHTTIGAAQTFPDYYFTSPTDSTTKKITVTNPSTCRDLKYQFTLNWGMVVGTGAQIVTRARAAQTFKVNGVIDTDRTSATTGGTSGGYDLSYDITGLTGVTFANQSTGYIDGTACVTTYVGTLAPGDSDDIEFTISLDNVLGSSTVNIALESINASVIGSTI